MYRMQLVQIAEEKETLYTVQPVKRTEEEEM